MEGKEEEDSNNAAKEAGSFPARGSSQDTHSSTDSGRDPRDFGSDVACRSQEATFPQQLMDVIETETTDGTSTPAGERVLEWLPNGDSFIIRDKALLEEEVLPKYFNAKCKFMSFVRWGFRQVEKNVPGVTIFTHTNFIRGDKKRCLLMRSIVKTSASSSSAQVPVTLLTGAPLSAADSGILTNQNLLEGLSRNFMGPPSQIPQLNQLLFPQGAAGGSLNLPNLFSMNQQQAGTFSGLISNGNLSNSFPLPGANLPSITMNASSGGRAAGTQQQFSITDFLNNGNGLNSNSLTGGTLPFNMTANVPSISSPPNVAQATNLIDLIINAHGQNRNSFTSNPAPVSTGASSNPTPSGTSTSSQSTAAAAAGASGAAGINGPVVGGDSPSPTVVLALQIMQNNPSIEPRLALELARRIRGET